MEKGNIQNGNENEKKTRKLFLITGDFVNNFRIKYAIKK